MSQNVIDKIQRNCLRHEGQLEKYKNTKERKIPKKNRTKIEPKIETIQKISQIWITKGRKTEKHYLKKIQKCRKTCPKKWAKIDSEI